MAKGIFQTVFATGQPNDLPSCSTCLSFQARGARTALIGSGQENCRSAGFRMAYERMIRRAGRNIFFEHPREPLQVTESKGPGTSPRVTTGAGTFFSNIPACTNRR